MRLRLLSLALLLVGPTGASGQQQADTDFDATVARPAYRSEHPRVLIDEAHFNFHTAGGRYKPFADLIACDGYRVSPNRDPFTKEALNEAHVLVIANALGAEQMGHYDAARPAFSEEECDIVRDWVRGGGALLLIADHPPFGAAAEGLARRFGVEMSTGVAIDPANSEGGESRLIFTRERGLLTDHAITRGRDESERIGRVMTFTGQSLRGPKGSVAFLKLGDTAVDQGGERVPAAGRAQGVALAFGEGRVVVLGEAGQLSAQILGPKGRPMGMNVSGVDNRQMALNIMHWLSGLID